jgi:predicted peptidase
MQRLLLLAVIAIAAPLHADEFESRVFHGPGGKTLPYRLLKPANYSASKHYPILLFLHGFGEHGTDNKAQLKHCVGLFLKPEVREKYPCFVIVPQSPGVWLGIPDFKKPRPFADSPAESLVLAVEALDSVRKQFSVDAHRLYVAGASNGGYATWYLLATQPKRWAAGVPMCGGGDPAHVAATKSVPIWAFHGEKDPTVPVQRSRELIAALKAAGGHPKFTEYPNVHHMEAADKAFKEPELLPWLFAQKRAER